LKTPFAKPLLDAQKLRCQNEDSMSTLRALDMKPDIAVGRLCILGGLENLITLQFFGIHLSSTKISDKTEFVVLEALALTTAIVFSRYGLRKICFVFDFAPRRAVEPV